MENPLGLCPKCKEGDLYVSGKEVACLNCHEVIADHPEARKMAAHTTKSVTPKVEAGDYESTVQERMKTLERNKVVFEAYVRGLEERITALESAEPEARPHRKAKS